MAYGTFLLDSAASPTFLNYTSSIGTKLTNPIPINTVNGVIHAKKKCCKTLVLPHGAKIDANALVLPGLTENLLSVHDVVTAHGPIIFTSKGVYSLPQRLLKILGLLQKLATCKRGLNYESDTIGQLTTITLNECKNCTAPTRTLGTH